jgi:ribonuclease P protein component
VGLVVGKKALPLAVDRNRVRRVLRESLRQARPALEAYDVIIRLKRGCPRTEYARVGADAAALIASLVGKGGER